MQSFGFTTKPETNSQWGWWHWDRVVAVPSTSSTLGPAVTWSLLGEPHTPPGAHQLLSGFLTLYSGSAPPGCSTVLLCETGCVHLISNNSFSSSVSPLLPASFPSRSLFYLLEGQLPCFFLVSTHMEYLLPSITSSQHVSLSWNASPGGTYSWVFIFHPSSHSMPFDCWVWSVCI